MTSRLRSLALGTAVLLIAVPAARAADERGSVQGVVNDASGKPVAGAFVKLKNADRRLTFMVISQGEGRFEAKDLPVGQYKVQGVGLGFESEWSADVGVAAGQSAKVGLSLAKKSGPMLPPAWPQRIPEEQVRTASLQLPDGEGKTLVAEKCDTCHDLRRVVVKRSS
jgi:Carboxypeptidase regulatory-like domain